MRSKKGKSPRNYSQNMEQERGGEGKGRGGAWVGLKESKGKIQVNHNRQATNNCIMGTLSL